MRYFAFVGFALFTALPTAAPDTVQIKEWEVPWANTRPRDPDLHPDGSIWFVGQRADYLARLNPVTGEFTQFHLEEGTGPHNLIINQAGQVWFAGNRKAYIGRLDPETGDIEKFPMPNPEARDPHTLTFGPGEHIFFTVQGGNFVGRLNTSTGEVKLTGMAVERSRPYGILVDPEGFPWFNQFGTNRIGRLNPDTMEVKTYVLPNAEARGRRIARTSDGYIWFTDYARGYLGRLDPETGSVKEWAAPSGPSSRPYALAADDKDRLWFVETGVEPNQFVGFDPDTETMFSITKIESGGGSVRHMVFDPKTRSIWFGTDANTIGRVRVP